MVKLYFVMGPDLPDIWAERSIYYLFKMPCISTKNVIKRTKEILRNKLLWGLVHTRLHVNVHYNNIGQLYDFAANIGEGTNVHAQSLLPVYLLYALRLVT